MAKWGDCDYRQLKQLQKRLQQLENIDLDNFCRDASKELAARLLSLVIPRTPVGVYADDSGKKGGTLRRGWTGGKNSNAKAYAQALPVHKSGQTFTIEVINPVEYASYVEFGHRQTPGQFVPAIGKRLKESWVDGQYFLTISEEEIKQIAPAIIQRKLDELLREVFNGGN